MLDEADRLLNSEFESDLRVVFKCLPKSRQTLLFSATMTSDLQALLEVSANKAYFYQAYEGLKTVGTLAQKYVFIPREAKEVYLVHILSKMEDMGVRSAIVFVSTLWYSCFSIVSVLVCLLDGLILGLLSNPQYLGFIMCMQELSLIEFFTGGAWSKCFSIAFIQITAS